MGFAVDVAVMGFAVDVAVMGFAVDATFATVEVIVSLDGVTGVMPMASAQMMHTNSTDAVRGESIADDQWPRSYISRARTSVPLLAAAATRGRKRRKRVPPLCRHCSRSPLFR